MFTHWLRSLVFLTVLATWCSLEISGAEPESFDVVVYGGNSAAIIAAVEAKRLGKSVVVVSPDKHLGGLSSGAWGSPILATKPRSVA